MAVIDTAPDRPTRALELLSDLRSRGFFLFPWRDAPGGIACEPKADRTLEDKKLIFEFRRELLALLGTDEFPEQSQLEPPLQEWLARQPPCRRQMFLHYCRRSQQETGFTFPTAAQALFELARRYWGPDNFA